MFREGQTRRCVRTLSVLTAVFVVLSTVVLAEPHAVAGSLFTVPGQYATIQAALDAAAPGDTVSVAPGTYAENPDFHGKDVHLVSTGRANETTIAGAGGTVVTIGPLGSIIGFTISGGTATFGAGMAVSGWGTVIKEDVFESNQQGSGGFGAAIAGNGASPTIEQNVFNDNSCDGQYLSGVVSFVNGSSPMIANNVFRDNPCRAVNLTVPAGTLPVVINNTIVHNVAGIYVDGRIPSTNNVIRNNIIVGNATGVQVEFGNSPTFDHNLVFDNTTNYSGVINNSAAAGNKSADPLFRNRAAEDFHLLPGSPALGAGSPSSAPTVDFDGIARPAQNIDIGAFALSTLARHMTFNCDFRARNGKFVSAEVRYAGESYGVLHARAGVVQPWERFTCVAIGTNQWALRSRQNGRYVSAELDWSARLYGTLRARARAVGAWETFTVPVNSSCAHCVALRSAANHLFVSAELGYSGLLYGLLRARAAHAASWESYTLVGEPN